MKNIPNLQIFLCFGSENLIRYAAHMLGLICEFWQDATMFERIPLSSRPTYVVMGT